jgi:hypothetical protein
VAVSQSGTLRKTRFIALVISALALLVALASVFVMASRPWGCSTSSASPAVTCDWVTSRWAAGIGLVAVVGISLISWNRWTLALVAVSLPLVAFSLISFAGVFTLAPAALWLCSALWLWSRDRPGRIALSALASVALLVLAVVGVTSLFYLATAPV